MCTDEESKLSFGKKLNFAKLKKHKGFENISEDEAVKLIDGLHKLSLLTFAIYKLNGNK
jgi:hypothetical protein